MMLRLIPRIFEAIEMVSGFNKLHRVIVVVMSELKGIRRIIAHEAICIDNTVRLDRSSNDRNQCILLGIRDDINVDLAAAHEQPE